MAVYGQKEVSSGPTDRKKTSFYGEFVGDVAGEREEREMVER